MRVVHDKRVERKTKNYRSERRDRPPPFPAYTLTLTSPVSATAGRLSVQNIFSEFLIEILTKGT